MAEFVQQSIEEMLPELEQMERIGLFTKEETNQILKKRRALEYRMRRRTKYKEDYMQYIEYEKNVLELISRRRKSSGIHYKKVEIDYAIVHRIHRLYRHVIARFQSDVELWLSHIKFSITRKEKPTVSRIFTQMLQVHSKNPDLWIAAAKWEFENNKNADNARNLMQRGLRFNPSSKPLWLEYYRLELLFVEKLRKRKELFQASKMKSEEHSEILEGAIAQIVYRKAVEAFPGDLKFALSFLPICRTFDFMSKQEDAMLEGLETLYPSDPYLWEAKAKRQLDIDQDHPLEMFHKVFEEATEKVKEDEIWSLYISACIKVIEKKSPLNEDFIDFNQEIGKLLGIFQSASEKILLSADLYKQWVKLLLDLGEVTEAEVVLEAAVTSHPQCVSLWLQRLELMIKTNVTEDVVLKAFKKARKRVSEKESYPLWCLVLEFCTACNLTQVQELFESGILACREVCIPVKETYLQWTYLRDGVKAARQLYTRLQHLKPLSLGFYHLYIQVEKSQVNQKIQHLRSAYEDAIKEYGSSDSGIWIEYFQLESEHPEGSAESAAQIHFRALRCLEGEENEKFVTKHTLMQTGHLR
ncbi:U3 small nucleolar RNA-associated protein 6 homolog [Saccostrea echinata]|uniref:U3 small nucleolar RNA-associated protein 6 homolog n=1 Tax=Saccostrea echinata TaxID=191078 RepID=UPI002A7F3159|nr:U3 small nucleolar RNA-associated protein 6 homolog [Saccostrea echinata]